MSDRAWFTHDYYGCETGCCGYSIFVSKGGEESRWFEFSHDVEEARKDLREKAAEFGVEIDAAACDEGALRIKECW